MKVLTAILFVLLLSTTASADYYKTTCYESTYSDGKRKTVCKTRLVSTKNKQAPTYMPPPRPHYFSRRHQGN